MAGEVPVQGRGDDAHVSGDRPNDNPPGPRSASCRRAWPSDRAEPVTVTARQHGGFGRRRRPHSDTMPHLESPSATLVALGALAVVDMGGCIIGARSGSSRRCGGRCAPKQRPRRWCCWWRRRWLRSRTRPANRRPTQRTHRWPDPARHAAIAAGGDGRCRGGPVRRRPDGAATGAGRHRRAAATAPAPLPATGSAMRVWN